MERPNLSRETKFLGANVDRGILIFTLQLTTSRIGKPYPVDPYSANVMTIYIYTCIHTY